MIVHVAKDLMMSSTAEATARSAGHPYQRAGTLEQLKERLDQDPTIRLVLVDLQTPGLDLSGLRSLLLGWGTGSGRRAIGYAQHVEERLLDDAQSMGLAVVMTRGQLNRSLESLFRALGTDGGSRPGTAR